jgi:hypothetical protein
MKMILDHMKVYKLFNIIDEETKGILSIKLRNITRNE